MSKITIPEPCHENWAEFTPTEKGAFCGSCQIDVIDFSNKSPIEIKSILKENAGKHLCGRFKKTQLVELNDDFFAWQNQSAKSLQSKFLYACLVVFGMTLFTGCESNQHVVGEMYYEAPIEQITEPESQNLNLPEESAPEKSTQNFKKGKIAYYQEEEVIKSCEPDSLINEREITMGDIMIIPEEEEEVEQIKVLGQFVEIETTEEPVKPDSVLFTDEMIDGGLRIDPEYINFLEDTVSTIKTPKKTVVPAEPIVLSPDFDGILFPNPSSDRASVQLNIHHEGHFEIYLYAIQGKKIKSIYSGNLPAGQRIFDIELSRYEPGSYLVVVNSKKQKETYKLEKVK